MCETFYLVKEIVNLLETHQNIISLINLSHKLFQKIVNPAKITHWQQNLLIRGNKTPFLPDLLILSKEHIVLL